MQSFTVIRSVKVPLDNGHQIEIKYSLWNGQEQVFFNGRLVSEKRSFMFVTAHLFTETEADQSISYEVNLLTGMMGGYGYIIRRNGIAVASQP